MPDNVRVKITYDEAKCFDIYIILYRGHVWLSFKSISRSSLGIDILKISQHLRLKSVWCRVSIQWIISAKNLSA